MHTCANINLFCLNENYNLKFVKIKVELIGKYNYMYTYKTGVTPFLSIIFPYLEVSPVITTANALLVLS